MRISRRAFFWTAILGLAIALVVLLQRRGDDPPVAEAAGSTRQSVDAVRTTQRVAPDAASAASITGSEDDGVMQCAQTVSDAADFATMERDAASPDQDPESGSDQLLADLDTAQRKLEGSRDPEQFLAALLLQLPERRASTDATAQAKLLDLGDRAIRSGSKMLAWHALNACVAAKQYCPIAHLEQRLLEADRQNAESWALVASLRYERGDSAGALAAMQGAARAPTSTWYWTDTIALVERSLAAQTTMTYVDRMVNAFGAGASVAFPVKNPREMCKAESASSRAWGEACLAFGTLRGKRNETLLGQLTAYSIREQALTALGDRAGAAEAAEELAHVRAEQRAMGQEPAMSMERLRSALIEADPSRLHAYLAAVQQFGEFAGARMFLRQEVPPLLQRAGLLTRGGVRECIAQFFVGTRRATVGQRAQVADELYVTVSSPSRGRAYKTVRIPTDGKIAAPLVLGTRMADGTAVRPEREILATGKTTEQLQREITTVLARYYQSPEVVLTLLSPGSPEELQLEFDNARKEAAERRSNSR